MEERFEGLETKAAYQENTIDALNTVIIQQQDQIDALRKRLDELEAQVKSILPSIIRHRDQETPPPHY